MPARTTSLDGAWDYLADSRGAYDPTTLPADGWGQMEIPNNWRLAGLDNYAGVVWFRRTFGQPGGDEPTTWLRFHGVDYQCRVWLNGMELGEHEGYFQPFEFRVPDGLLAETNTLLVRVDSPKEDITSVWPYRKRVIKGVLGHHDCRPGSNTREHGQDENTGGIWNSVELVRDGLVRITRVKLATRLRPAADGGVTKATITTTIFVENAGPAWRGRCSVRLLPREHAPLSREILLSYVQPQWQIDCPSGSSDHSSLSIMTEPQLWWTWDLGEPFLYEARIMLVRDDGQLMAEHRQLFGLREIAIDEQQRWYLNGEPLFIRGANVIPTQWLAEYRSELIATDIAQLKSAHVNCVRVHAHVNREEYYRACDEAGILVWQDFALQWSYSTDPDFMTEAVRQIKDMVRLHYNHPSIAVWCCHNEPLLDNRHVLDPLLGLAVREEDGTRPVVPASDMTSHPYPGWYYGNRHQFAARPGGPLVTEFGAQALPNRESLERIVGPDHLWPQTQADWERWFYHDFQYDTTFQVAQIERGASVDEFIANSQQYQYDLLKDAIETYRRGVPAITGLFPFMFMDCWPSITWSVIDYWRQPKLGYEALRLAYQPVLVSLELMRREIEPVGLFILRSLAIVNDRREAYPGCTVAVSVVQEEVVAREVFRLPVDVPARGVVRPYSWDDLVEPSGLHAARALGQLRGSLRDLAPGEYRLRAVLTSAAGETLSTNYERFRLLPPRSGEWSLL